MKNVIINSLLLLFLLVGQSFAATWYVRPLGGNYGTEDGTSYENAWVGIPDWYGKGIKWGSGGITAGDTLYVCGTHSEYLMVKASGSLGKEIIIRGDCPGDPGILDGKNHTVPSWRGDGILTIWDQSYITISDITVTKTKSHGICVGAGSSHIKILNSTVSYAYDGCITVYPWDGRSATDITIDNCKVDHCDYIKTTGKNGYDEAISLAEVDGFEVKNCTVRDSLKEGIDAKYGTKNGSIHDNLVYNNYSVGIYLDGAENVNIYNNEVYGSHQNGNICIWVEKEEFPNKNIRIYNNILRDGTGDGINFGWISKPPVVTAGINDISIINNTIIGNKGDGLEFNWWLAHGSGHLKGDNIVRNNIFWENGGKEINDNTDGNSIINGPNLVIDHNLFITGASTETRGSNHVDALDMYFADKKGKDFHLTSDSPADRGSSQEAPSEDFDGKVRPSGSGYDIGAYEFFAAGLNPPPRPKGLRITSK